CSDHGYQRFRLHRGWTAWSREIILPAGAYDSAPLLELSGIRDPELLKELGVPLRHALLGVGQNLQGHFQAPKQMGEASDPCAVVDAELRMHGLAISPRAPAAQATVRKTMSGSGVMEA